MNTTTPTTTIAIADHRELDALVAEHVMGWRWYLPRYSTHISAAWQVVIKLERTHHWLLKTPFDPADLFPTDLYWAGLTPHGVSGFNGTPDHYASASTMPQAICLAALLANGVEAKFTREVIGDVR